jgi:hypothetical protein
MIARALFAILLAASCVPVLAAMYKWVDDKGVTHYTEEPPADRKSTRLDLAPSGPTAAPAQDAEEWRKKEQENRKKGIEKAQGDEKDKAAADNEAQMRANRCTMASRQLQTLTAARPVFQVNDKGEKVILEDKERNTAIERYQKDLKAYCDTK